MRKEEFFDDDTVNQSEPINCLLQTASLDFNIKRLNIAAIVTITLYLRLLHFHHKYVTIVEASS